MAKKSDVGVHASPEYVKLVSDAFPERPYPRVQKHFYKPSLTRRSEMPSTDLKALVRRYQQAGALPPSQLQYGDVSALPKSRLEAMEALEAAREAFQSLPLKVRQAVNHDPRLLEQWIVANPQLAVEYGLAVEVPKSSSPANPSSSGGAGEGKDDPKKPKATSGSEDPA